MFLPNWLLERLFLFVVGASPSQNHTPTALVPISLPPPLPPPIPSTLIPPALRLPPIQIFPDNLPTHVHKHLVHIQSPPRAGFIVGDVAPHLRDLEGFGAGDAAVVFEIGFVADEDDWDGRVVVFHMCDLFAEFAEFGEGGCGGYAED